MEEDPGETAVAADGIGLEERVPEGPVVIVSVPAFAGREGVFVEFPGFGPRFVEAGAEGDELQVWFRHVFSILRQDTRNFRNFQPAFRPFP